MPISIRYSVLLVVRFDYDPVRLAARPESTSLQSQFEFAGDVADDGVRTPADAPRVSVTYPAGPVSAAGHVTQPAGARPAQPG